MYKFIYMKCDKTTHKVTKVCEAFYTLYESCMERERIESKGLDHNKYDGHSIIAYL